MRAERAPADAPVALVLAAADPANPYGLSLPWPKKAQRVAGAHVVLVDGEPALYVERSGKGLVTMPAFEDHAAEALSALRSLVENSPRREMAIERIDGETALSSPHRPALEQAGFAREYLGLTLRVGGLAHPRARSA